MADDDKLDEIIYTITTGFYPQLFAGKGPSFGSGSKFVKGKGRVGAKSAQVKGWAGKKSFVIEKDGIEEGDENTDGKLIPDISKSEGREVFIAKDEGTVSEKEKLGVDNEATAS